MIVQEAINTPCGTCSLCCWLPVKLNMWDKPSLYQTETIDGETYILRADGHCVYLFHGRCSIHSHRPWLCKTFDCALSVCLQDQDDDIAERGKQLLRNGWRGFINKITLPDLAEEVKRVAPIRANE